MGALRGFWKLTAQFRVVGVFSTSMGKFPEGETAYYAYFNIKTTLQYFIRSSLSDPSFPPSTVSALTTLISSVSLEQFA